ncbi:O-antigen ligase family protein [uncultured Helicobacter sp.]|uniref:O-antigen ligase family protein n=3 Tax=uncultured Helicobacter sp. TaxID=175537 RepID=UPI0025D1EAE3|nr:O-antigen ligase family protein [uncultured Helicobacter sp.]
MLHYIKRYNQEIALGFFATGMLFYALGITSFGKGFAIQTFIHIGGLLFIIYNYRSFSVRTWRILMLPIICFSIVAILGLLTIFDDVWQRKVSVVLKAINQNIIGIFVLFVIMFLYAMYARFKNVLYFLCFFALLCLVEVCSTIYLGVSNGFFKGANNVPYFFKAIFTYNLWLLAPMAISLAAVMVCKKPVFKLLGVCGIILTFIAMLANGERSFIVTFVCMLFVPFILWHYKHKMQIALGTFSVIILCIVGFYHVSKDLPLRYNFAHMLDNFLVVWQSSPAEMGQFDEACFDIKQKWLRCAEESLVVGKNEISIEHSALSRINMSKSTFLAVLDEPFKPHIVGVFQVGEYLWHYYNRKNPQNRSYIVLDDQANKNANGYNSPHNFAISLLFCYGIIGFLCIVAFQGFLLYSAKKSIKQKNVFVAFWGLVLGIFVIGICAQSLFDVFYTVILQPMFIIFGILAGLGWRDENLTYHR